MNWFREIVLIETLWNVKADTFIKSSDLHSVLIETLWNVKMDRIKELSSASVVLIETLWNVKLFFLLLLNDAGFRINRNIVECKGLHMRSF